MSGIAHSIDHDSLHILPLSLIPLQVKSLQEKRLVKTARLETVVELYNEARSGSGQIAPTGLSEVFDFSGERAADLRVIKRLCDLHSYDVYSLRVGLRRLGIDVENHAKLKLSDEMSASLADHMSAFTRPLVVRIYGNVDTAAQSLGDILKLFMDPNNDTARQNLRDLATTLGIELAQLPQFLEDYADVYLSLSFFQKCRDNINAGLGEFADELRQMAKTPSLKDDTNTAIVLERTAEKFLQLHGELSNVLEMFQTQTEDMWQNLSAERYRRLTGLVVDHQEKIGAILCAVTVKLAAWQRLCSTPQLKGLREKANFVATDMSCGLELLDGLAFQDT